MRILFLTEGPEIPSSRYRVEQFVPHFEAAGIQCTVHYAYGTAYNSVAEKTWGAAYKLATRLRRAAWTIAPGRWDIVFLQRTALPGSAIPELLRAATQGAKLLYDFDDAVYLGATNAPSPFRAQAFRDAVRIADAVVAGNQHLAERVADPSKTMVIPTVVDTDTYVPPAKREPANLVVGWMGTASNFPSLRETLPAILAEVKKRPRVRFRVVSNGALPELVGVPQVEQVRWSPSTEVELLQSFDIGLMPLVDSESTLGKCGFKMLQYMAVGAAPLATGVGANLELVGASGGAVLVGPAQDWAAPLGRLLDEDGLRAEVQAKAREHVDARYSVKAAVPRFLGLFERLHRGERPYILHEDQQPPRTVPLPQGAWSMMEAR